MKPDITLEAEFDFHLARHGIRIPAERRIVMFQAFVDFRALLDEMHDELEPALEPAYIHAANKLNDEAPK